MNGATFLAIPSATKDSALFISSYHTENGFITDYVDKDYVHETGYNLYLYESVNKIKRVRVAGGNNEDPSIIAFKKDGKINFQALVKIL
jgi:hypothetical protein